MNEIILQILTLLVQNLDINLVQLLWPSYPQFTFVILAKQAKVIDICQHPAVAPVNQDLVRKCFKFKQNAYKYFSSSRMYALKQSVKISSLLALPILVKQKVEAVLILGTAQPDIKATADLKFVNFVAEMLAFNLKNYGQLQQLKQLAEVDEVTGLYNQNYMRRRLFLELKRSKRYGHTFSIVLVDLDNFKQINDNFGHLTGDKMLSKIGLALTSASRATDIVGRFGGDEFLVILPETTLAQTELFIKRLQINVSNLKLTTQSGACIPSCKISLGKANFPESANDVQNLISIADKQLYRQKADNRLLNNNWLQQESETSKYQQKSL